MSWRDLSDGERERAYSPSSCLPDGDYRPFVAEYRRASEVTRTGLDQWAGARTTTVRYGDAPSHTIDLAVPTGAGGPAPLLVFFHGGYWQELSKLDSFFPARDCVQQGVAYAAVDYTLAPAASLDDIIEECRQAVAALVAKADVLGLDPARVHLAGSSAGAHLAAMTIIGHPPAARPIAGAALISGIYDLEPLLGTSINQALGLDLPAARRASPLVLDLTGFPPTVLAYGENETEEFKSQTRRLARRLAEVGTAVSTLEIDDRNHFDVVMTMTDPSARLGQAVATLIDPQGGTDANL